MIRQIAVGAITELYLTRTVGVEGFEKLACVKRILPQHIDNPSFVGMFLNEARLAATLHHPNIAQVYEIGHDSGEHFFAMEYVHGEDLGRLVATGRDGGVPISLDCVLTIVAGLCAGLHHAHDKSSLDGKPLGVVHRDVSPSNVLISYDGAVKLVDFGIARAGGEPSASQIGLKGKAAYLSPEQIRRRTVVDRRSDVFSVGTILYELTTGRLPFDDATEFGILQKIVNGELDPPSVVVPGYPPALEAIVLRALQREPDRRFATALALQEELEDFADDHRLRISPLVLARLMSTLFPARLEEWDHARAQGAFFVEQHVVRTLIESGKTTDSAPREMPEPLPVFDDGSAQTPVPTAAAQPPARGSQPSANVPVPPSLPGSSLPLLAAPALAASASALPRPSSPLAARPRLVSRTTIPPPSGESPAAPRSATVSTPPPSGESPAAPRSATASTLPRIGEPPASLRNAPTSTPPPPSGEAPAAPRSAIGSPLPPSLRPSSQLEPGSLRSSLPLPGLPRPMTASTPPAPSSEQPVPGAPSTHGSPSSSHPAPQLSQLSSLDVPGPTSPSLSVAEVQAIPGPRRTPQRSAIPPLPGAVPVLHAFSAPPVPSGGTLVSSATQAGNPPPAVKPVAGPYGSHGLDGRAGHSGHHLGISPPVEAYDDPVQGDDDEAPTTRAPVRRRRGGTRRDSDGRFDPTAARRPWPGRDDDTERVRVVPPSPPMQRRRSRARYLVLAMIGVAGISLGAWLALSGGSLAQDPRAPGKVESAEVVPRLPESQPRAQDPGRVDSPPLTAAPATAVEAAAAPARVEPPALRPAAAEPSAAEPAQPPKPAQSARDVADLPKRKPTRTTQPDPRAKAVKPRPRSETKRPAKSQAKEQPWSNDSPFMPVATPKR